MRVERRADRLVLRDAPGGFWTLGGLFLIVGVPFAAGPFGLFTNGGELTAFGRIASVLLGLAGIATGGYLFASNPASVCTFDRRDGSLTMRRRGPFVRAAERHAIAEIVAVRVEEGRDDEGGVICRPQALLRTGAVVALSRLWSHDPAGCRRTVLVAERSLSRGE